MFKINYTKLVQWLIPMWLRQPMLKLMVLSINYPIRELYNDFLDYRAAKLYDLAHNSQTCYLQAMLNDQFDLVRRRIRILDFDFASTIYLYADAEDQDVLIGDDAPIYLDPDDAGIDFLVQLPRGMSLRPFQLARMKSLLNYYKLASKKYTIQ